MFCDNVRSFTQHRFDGFYENKYFHIFFTLPTKIGHTKVMEWQP